MANLSNINNKFLVTTTGEVLIGGTAAIGAAKLQVTGEARVYTGSNLGYWGVDAGNSYVYLGTNSSGYGLSLQTAGTERMRIDSSGNVGIGVTPSATYTGYRALDIGLSGQLFSNASGGDSVALVFNAYLNTGASAWVRKQASAASFLNQSDNGFQFYTAPSDSAGTNATFTERMRIDSSGTVGIGMTPDPVASSTYVLQLKSASTQAYMSIGDTVTGGGPLNGLVIGVDASGAHIVNREATTLDFHTNNGVKMTILSGGNVGIGTDSPDLKLDVESTNSSAFSGTGYRTALFQSTSAVNADKPGITLGYDTTGGGIIAPATQAGTTNFLGFWTYNSGWGERVRIAKDGNVGIGTTSPDLGGVSGTRVLTIASPESERWGILELAGNRTWGGNQVGEIKFISTDASNLGTLASLTAINDTSLTGNGGSLKFSTKPDGGTLTERMQISSGGVVGIPTLNTQSIAKLGVRVNGSAIEFGHTNTSDWYFGTVGSYGSAGNPFISFSCMNEQSANTWTTKGVPANIIQQASGGSLQFMKIAATNSTGQSPTLAMELYDGGRLHPVGGIFLGSSNNSNLLDDYEEGTWNVGISSTGGNMTNIAFTNEKYTKIGNLVTYSFNLSGSFTSAATESSVGFNLPFTADSTQYKSVGIVSFFIGPAPNRFGVGAIFLGTTSATLGFIYIAGREVQQSGAWGDMRVTATFFAA